MIEKRREVAQRVLVSLYDAWAKNTIISLGPIRETSGLEKGVFHTLVEELEDGHGLIKAYGSSYTFEMTPAGVLYVEDNELISKDRVEKRRNVRNSVIGHLMELYDHEGSLADSSVDELAAAASYDKFEILQDLSFLNEVGYIRNTSVNTYQITEEGLRNLRGDQYVDII